MPLENSTNIAGLDNTWPLTGDPTMQGAAHIRLIKDVLKAIFPGSAGHGFSKPITATEDQLNLLAGLTALPNPIPKDTKMLFAMSAAPVGWVQDTADAYNNRMLRVVADGSGNGIGGTHSPILNNVVPAHTHNFTTSGASNDHSHVDSGHAHTTAVNYQVHSGAGYPGATGSGDRLIANTLSSSVAQAAIGGQTANHSHSGSTDGGSSSTNWQPRYLNLICCTKS